VPRSRRADWKKKPSTSECYNTGLVEGLSVGGRHSISGFRGWSTLAMMNHPQEHRMLQSVFYLTLLLVEVSVMTESKQYLQ
jgi:hypothetical protein